MAAVLEVPHKSAAEGTRAASVPVPVRGLELKLGQKEEDDEDELLLTEAAYHKAHWVALAVDIRAARRSAGDRAGERDLERDLERARGREWGRGGGRACWPCSGCIPRET